jgi:hypothetical protein
MWIVIVIVFLSVIILRKVSGYPAVNLYKDMQQGNMRTNQYVGFLQEGQEGMMTRPYTNTPGYSIPIEDKTRKYMFQEAPDEYDFTKPIDHPYTEPIDEFDYTRSVTFDYKNVTI